MTTELTTRERVQQAVMRQFELIAEREVARGHVDDATNVRNTIRSSNKVEETDNKASVMRDATVETAHSTYVEHVEKLSKPLQRAQEKFNRAESEARQVRDVLVQEAEDMRQDAISAAQAEYEMAMAAAEADIHRANAEVSAIEDTIAQHREVVRNSLGIDLNTLTGAL